MVKEQVMAIIAKGEYSQNKIAAEIDFSGAALSQYLKGKYTGDNAGIESALTGFLRRQNQNPKQENILFYPSGIVETQATKIVRSLANRAYQEGEICMICGEAGSGKTSAIEAYEFQNKGTIVITAEIAYTQRVLFTEIAEAIGEPANGTVYSICKRIKSRLKGIRRTIIIDEAQLLPYTALEQLRSVFDACKFGLLLVGTETLYGNIKGRQNQYSQLYSRVASYRTIPRMNESDAINALTNLGVNKEIALKCLKETDGKFRNAAKLVANIKHLVEANGREVDDACIQKAKSALVM
jgi:DNA transposition AAA+ family ATPase